MYLNLLGSDFMTFSDTYVRPEKELLNLGTSQGKTKLNISIRNLVETMLRCGDINSSFQGTNKAIERALEGTKLHQKLQKAGGENYNSEVSLKYTHITDDFIVILEGRADGIIVENSLSTIDEIKTTSVPLEYIDENFNPLHMAQAKCYAYIYCTDNNLTSIDVQLTYYNVDTDEIKKIRKTYNYIALKQFFYQLLDKYLSWMRIVYNWYAARNSSLKALNFPFENYREGQRELAVSAYRTICEHKKIFVQAPTGIGKTISTIFPAIKAIGEGKTSKIFYLTAKSITRKVAETCIDELIKSGLTFKYITITAKDKICFKETTNCNPDYCQYAKGHFDRIDEAIYAIYKKENALNREVIVSYAKQYMVCPFELSLDLSLWADLIICDYNYVFDPTVYLKRFFQLNTASDYSFLVDEAHNLVDRGRAMFSAELFKAPFLKVKKQYLEKKSPLGKIVGKINSMFLDMKKNMEDGDFLIQEEALKKLCGLLRIFVKEAEPEINDIRNLEFNEALLELYFNAYNFIKISEFYDERYVAYIEKTKGDVKVKMFCLDPSYLLKEALERGQATVFFSATLTPIDYFREILGGDESSYQISLPSPFDVNNLGILIANKISTKYLSRENSYSKIVEYIYAFISGKTGNYLVFFPSYKYMQEVHNRFAEVYPEIETLLQEGSMDEATREAFLSNFKAKQEKTLIAFAVLGGIFSEGIDLKGDRLIGAVIVGVGLPQLSLERGIIQSYFSEKKGMGFEYSYMYPGMNKVLQAAGRVIRSEEDKGLVLLIDERFSTSYYKRIFPSYWRRYIEFSNIESLKKFIDGFWKQGK